MGISAVLKEKPTTIRLLGEDLVLFRDGQGRVGVVGALCSHRRANLCLGNARSRASDAAITGGFTPPMEKCFRPPASPREPTCGIGGGILVSGTGIRRFGVHLYGTEARSASAELSFPPAEGERDVYIQAFNDCNWLQCVENGIDPFHVSFVHGDVWTAVAKEPEKIIFEETEWGAVYKAIRPGRSKGEYNYREHPIIMPGISSGGDSSVSMGEDVKANKLPTVSARWSVPVDDTHR